MFEKARTQRAHEVIVAQLQRRILSGELPPGSRLPSERVLMSQFEVSRPTVREALRVAENQGLVAIRPGDPGGPKVLGQPSVGVTRLLDGMLDAGQASALELLEIRLVLDASAAAMVRPEDLGEAWRCLEGMEAGVDFAEWDWRFHEALLEASGNRLFLLVYRAVREPIQKLMQERLQDESGRPELLRQHRVILEAIEESDPAGAAAAARAHLWAVYEAGLAESRLRSGS